MPRTLVPARAPHFWLDAKTSSLDLFGAGFVLLAFAEVATAALTAAAHRREVPLTVHRIESDEGAKLYERRLVLVRPDGHVAWRGDRLPDDCLTLLDTVRGAGPRIAAKRAAG